MRRLILARHAHTAANAAGLVTGVPPGAGLSELGVAQALGLGSELAGETVELGAATELRRTQQTLELALRRQPASRLVVPALNEILVGAFEGGPLDEYRRWAWNAAPDAPCPGGGESRTAVATRIAGGLETLLGRPEETVVLVAHALTIRYVLRGARGAVPTARIGRVPHASPYRLGREEVEIAAETLRRWQVEPRFATDEDVDAHLEELP